MEVGKSELAILTGTHTGKRPLGRPRRRWKDNIIMDLKVIGVNAKSWIDSAHKGSPIIPNLSRLNQISRIDTYFFTIHFNIVLPFTPRSS